MVAPLEKIRKLIALAGSSSEEEARTAAYHACRLIREHDVKIGASTSANDSWSSPAAHYAAASRPPPGPPPAKTGEYVRIRTKFESTCRHCGKSIRVEDEMAWSKGKSSYHWICYVELIAA